jgi:iron complex outermembrane recepter protein
VFLAQIAVKKRLVNKIASRRGPQLIYVGQLDSCNTKTKNCHRDSGEKIIMKTQFKTALLAATFLSATGVSTAFAQSTPTPSTTNPPARTTPATPAAQGQQRPTVTPGTEVVVVTGFRTSLAAGLQIKQLEISVTDSIVAEDIGKFPTQNIAEALQRIPGVEMTRNAESNEGNRIQLRGLGSEFTLTTFNGAPVSTTSSSNIGNATRDFNYDVFPSELFARADVIKTPRADLNEGGVSGVVDLRTPRPFDRPGRRINYGVQGQYNTQSEYWNPRANLSYSNTWGKFGVLAGIAYAGNRNRRGGFESTGLYYNEEANILYNPNAAFNDIRRIPPGGTVPGVFPAPGGTNGIDTFRLDFNHPLANLNGLTRAQLQTALVPRIFRSVATQNDRERLGGLASFQYKGDRLTASFDTVFSKVEDVSQRHILGFPTRGSVRLAINGVPNLVVGNSTNIPAWVPIRPTIDANGLLQGTFGNVSLQNASTFFESETDFKYDAVNAKFSFSNTLALNFQMASTESTARRIDNTVILNGLGALHTITFNTTDDPLFPTLSTDRNLLDPTIYNELLLSGVTFEESDKQFAVKMMLDWDYEFGSIEGKLRFGVSSVEATKTLVRQSYGNGGADAINPLSNTLIPIAGGGTIRFGSATAAQRNAFFQPRLTALNLSGFTNQGSTQAPTSWLVVGSDFLNDFLNKDAAAAASPRDNSTSFEALESTIAYFIQTDFRTTVLGNSLRGNVGVRYIETETDIDNFTLRAGVPIPNNSKGSYDKLLPSATIAYNVTPKIIVRGAYGETLTRSSLRQIASPITIPNVGQAFVTLGNPDLLPQYSKSTDLAGEWYFARGGIVSIGWFKKDIENRPASTSSQVAFSTLGLPDSLFGSPINTGSGVSPDLLFTVQRPVNLDAYEIKGWEFAYQQAFTFLPKPFDGLGALASATMIETANLPWTAVDGSKVFLPILPELTYSATLYYEKGKFSARTSYTWRDEQFEGGNNSNALTQNNGINGQIWSNARGYLDASIGYKLSRMFEIRLEAQNLTKTRTYNFQRQRDGLYGDENSRVEGAFQNGTNISLGIKGSF